MLPMRRCAAAGRRREARPRRAPGRGPPAARRGLPLAALGRGARGACRAWPWPADRLPLPSPAVRRPCLAAARRRARWPWPDGCSWMDKVCLLSPMPCVCAFGPWALDSSATRRFFIFIFFKNIFYRNIFLVSHFIVLYPYRPAGGPQGPTCK